MLSRTSLRRRASRLQSGSSIRNSRGLRTIARAIATRWRWPPESFAGLQSSSASSCSICATYHSRLPAAFLFLAHLHAEGDVVGAPTDAEQGIVLEIIAKLRSRGVVAVMFSSCSQIWPSLTGSSPASRRSRVLFPQPDGPTSTTNSPSWISSDRALSAGLPSKRLLNVLQTEHGS